MQLVTTQHCTINQINLKKRTFFGVHPALIILLTVSTTVKPGEGSPVRVSLQKFALCPVVRSHFPCKSYSIILTTSIALQNAAVVAGFATSFPRVSPTPIAVVRSYTNKMQTKHIVFNAQKPQKLPNTASKSKTYE